MQMPAAVRDSLTTPAAYKVCRLQRTDAFAKFCADRGLKVDAERLRRLEKLGLFKPLLRVRCGDVVRKIETQPGNLFRDLGPMGEDEVWGGETRTELMDFDFYPHVVANWIEHGVLWSPEDGVPPYDAEIDAEPRRHLAFYSQFQIWDLACVLTRMTLRVSADNAVDADGQATGNHENLAQLVADMARDELARRDEPRLTRAVGLFLQVISDRYFTQTQTDQRTTTFSRNGMFHDWKWDDYARAWSPEDSRAQFAVTSEILARIYSQLCAELRFLDPLDAWRPLTKFVKVDQRQHLKGDALRAQTMTDMAEMLRRFHRDAFGEDLPDPDDRGWPRDRPAPARDDPYRALELVTNRYGLNPRPRLVLFVEGQTEDAVIPEIFDRWFGVSPWRYGIQIRHLNGVGNATGGKSDTLSALWRLVDYLHAQQTLAVVLFDQEGLAPKNLREGLAKSRSLFFPDRRVTRHQYVRLWRQCFEFDNFSDTEIATAMTKLGGGTVTRAEVARCRRGERSDGKLLTLKRAYRAANGEDLDKVALGLSLVKAMFDPGSRRKAGNRPIIRFLEFVATRAALNHPPTSEGRWAYNQRSGYVGALMPGAGRRRRNPTDGG